MTDNTNIVKRILSDANANEKIIGILLFGSRVLSSINDCSDTDIGIIYFEDYTPDNLPDDWDVFLWKKERWERGFPLQLELARKSIVLFDPLGIVAQRLEFLRRNLLPDWGHYLYYKPGIQRTQFSI